MGNITGGVGERSGAVTGWGKLVVFEGIDGSGLSTQAKLLHDYLRDVEHLSVHLTKEPTDGPIGSPLRLALRGRMPMDHAVMALCFAADRLDHLTTEIVPRLEAGVHVIADRYVLSSLAYQSLDLDLAWLRAINSRARPADITIHLDVPAEISMARLRASRWQLELFETSDRLRSIRQSYQRIVPLLRDTGENIVTVPGTAGGKERTIAAVAEDVRANWQRIRANGG